jgi:type IV pilus assembly protein PilO
MARAEVALNRLPVAAKFAVGIGLVAVLAIAYVVVFYGDLSNSINTAKSEEGRLRRDLAEARKNEFVYEKDLAELTLRQQRQRELNKMLPTNTEYPAFLSAVQNVANVTGVSLTAWSPNQEVTQEFYARVPMKLELSGRFHQVAKFLYGIGQLDRIINMENISLSDPKQVGDDLILKVESLATAFRAVENATVTSTDKRGAAQGGGK